MMRLGALLQLLQRCAGFSITHIEGGSLDSVLSVAGGSSLYLSGSDLGDPVFHPPAVLISVHPDPTPTPCLVQGFTSSSTRIHCIIQGIGLPAQPAGAWGAESYKTLTVHVLKADGTEAACAVLDRTGRPTSGTQVGHCGIRFDVGRSPRIVRSISRELQGGETLLVEAHTSSEPWRDAVDHQTLELVRGDQQSLNLNQTLQSKVGCLNTHPEFGERVHKDPRLELRAKNQPTTVGCRLEAQGKFASGFWNVSLHRSHENRGYAVVDLGSRRVDVRSNTMYDVETVARILSVTPAAGSAAGGSQLTIRTSGLGAPLGDIRVTAAGAECKPLSLSDGELTCAMLDSPAAHGPWEGDRGVRWQWWAGGESFSHTLASLRQRATFPDEADGEATLAAFDKPAVCGASACAGSRLSGWFVAPLASDFSFVLAADEEAELWWSGSASAAPAERLARTEAGSDGSWPAWGGSSGLAISKRVPLAAGERVWLELVCAGMGTKCAVGTRVHVSAMPAALSFGQRGLAPLLSLREDDSCGRLSADDCGGRFHPADGPCFLAAGALSLVSKDGRSSERCVSSKWLADNPQPAAKLAASPVAASQGRTGLAERVGCGTVASRAECCTKLDGRGGLYKSQPCVPAVSSFHSGRVCEAASWVKLFDSAAAASCEELAAPVYKYEHVAHTVQQLTIDSPRKPEVQTITFAREEGASHEEQVTIGMGGVRSEPISFAAAGEQVAAALVPITHPSIPEVQVSTSAGGVAWEVTFGSPAWACVPELPRLEVASAAANYTANARVQRTQTAVCLVGDLGVSTGSAEARVPLGATEGAAAALLSSSLHEEVLVRQSENFGEARREEPFRFVGCFGDSGRRAFTGGSVRVGKTDDLLNKCASRCDGYAYMALQDGDECYCGDSYLTDSRWYAQKPARECSGGGDYCPVENGCGGKWRNSIYSLAPPPSPPAPPTQPGRLAWRITRVSHAASDALAINASALHASDGGAVSVTSEVIAGGGVDALPITGDMLIAPSRIPVVSVRPAGKSAALCASPDFPSLRRGCYNASGEFTLQHEAQFENGLTLERCATHCREWGLERGMVAVQAPHTCGCVANVRAEAELSEQHCSEPCSGDESELCGSTAAKVAALNDDGWETTVATPSVAVYGIPASTASAACRFDVLPAEASPLLSSISVSKGRAGAEVALGGARLASDGVQPTVTLCGKPAAVLSATSSRVTVRAPACGPEPEPVLLNVPPLGRAIGPKLTFRGVLAVASAHPARGGVGGGVLLGLSGSGFASEPRGMEVDMLRGDELLAACEVVSSSAAGLICRTSSVPASAAGSSLTLRVTVRGSGETVAVPEAYTLLPMSETAQIESVTPATGSALGGVQVCMLGQRLLVDDEAPTVSLGGSSCAVASATATQICCTTSAHAEGEAAVSLADSRGLALLLPTAAPFTFATPASVTSLEPSRGHEGTTLTVRGSGLALATITLGGKECAAAPRGRSDAEITCTAPDHPRGEASLELSVPAGRVEVPADVAFTYEVVVTAVQTATGGVSAFGGAELTLVGGGFHHLAPPPSVVWVGGKPCPVISLAPASIVCTAPALVEAEGGFVRSTANLTSEAVAVAVPGARCAGECTLTYAMDATPLLLSVSTAVARS